MKIYLQKQKKFDESNSCEIEGSLVKETIIFQNSDETLFIQLKNSRNLRCWKGFLSNKTIFWNSDTRWMQNADKIFFLNLNY